MGSPGTPQPGGPPAAAAPAPGGAPQGAPAGGPNPLQILAGITKLAQTLAQVASPCAPEAQQIIQSVQQCAQKIMGAQQAQPGAGGPAPY